jgi:hypothetical protein
MEKLSPQEQQIADFIYKHPDVVVKVLNNNGYKIEMKTATLSKINELVYKAIFIDNNLVFAKDFDNTIANEGYSGLIVMLAVAVVSAVVTAVMARDRAKKELEFQRNKALAELSQNEMLAMEKLRAESETARTLILSNSLLEYRNTLQTQSTIRLRDTWIYVTGLAVGIGVIWGVVLLLENK